MHLNCTYTMVNNACILFQSTYVYISPRTITMLHLVVPKLLHCCFSACVPYHGLRSGVQCTLGRHPACRSLQWNVMNNKILVTYECIPLKYLCMYGQSGRISLTRHSFPGHSNYPSWTTKLGKFRIYFQDYISTRRTTFWKSNEGVYAQNTENLELLTDCMVTLTWTDLWQKNHGQENLAYFFRWWISTNFCMLGDETEWKWIRIYDFGLKT